MFSSDTTTTGSYCADIDDGLDLGEIEELSENADMLSQDAVMEEAESGSESEFYSNEDMDISASTNLDQSIFAPIISNANEVKAKLLSAFKDLGKLSPVHVEEQKLLNNTRVLVSITKIQELKGDICFETLDGGELWGQSRTFEYDTRGTVLVLRWSCSNNHAGLWKSSEVLCRSYTTDIYLNDTLVSACIFLSCLHILILACLICHDRNRLLVDGWLLAARCCFFLESLH